MLNTEHRGLNTNIFKRHMQTLEKKRLDPCPLFIAGEWQETNGVPTSPVHNPSTGEVIAETPMCEAKHVDAAVDAAAAAFPEWWETPPTERARVLFKFRMLMEDNFD